MLKASAITCVLEAYVLYLNILGKNTGRFRLLLHTCMFFFLSFNAVTFASVRKNYLYCVFFLIVVIPSCYYLNQNCTMPTKTQDIQLENVNFFWFLRVNGEHFLFNFWTIICDNVAWSLLTGFTLKWLLVAGHPVVVLTILLCTAEGVSNSTLASESWLILGCIWYPVLLYVLSNRLHVILMPIF